MKSQNILIYIYHAVNYVMLYNISDFRLNFHAYIINQFLIE